MSQKVDKQTSDTLRQGKCPCGGRLLRGPRGGLSQMGKCDTCGVEYTVHPWPFECEKHFREPLTWKCHICKEERPDSKISVLTKPMTINGQACGEQNIRYCNDRPACIEGANEFSFFKEA